MAKARKRSRAVFTAGAILLVAGALTAAFWPKPMLVDMGEVTRGTLRLTIDNEGRTRVRDAYIVSTPVAGQLLRVQVQPGAEVVRGETIVAHMRPINPAALDVRTREQAEAAVTAAQAALRVARADLNAALANRDLSDSELQRTIQLVDRGVSTSAALDRARQTARVAQANVDTAEAAIAMREAEIINVQAQLIGFDDPGLIAAVGGGNPNDIPLFAPSTGRILRLIQQSETTLPAGAAIMEIGNVAGDLEVVVALLSTDAVQVAAGDPVIITDWGRDTDLAGRVNRVDPFGITQFSALGVEEQRVNAIIDFTGPEDAHAGLGHGFRVEARIIVREAHDITIVPSSALFRSRDTWSVFAVIDGVATLRTLQIGANNGSEAQVIEGLTEGETVILYPSSGLSDGATVAARVVN